MDEFELIEAFFADAQVGPSVDVPIGDDGAVVSPRPGTRLVLVTDALVEGVHFPEGFAAADLGFRTLQVNLSDVAAMGARPRWMTLSLTLREARVAWLRGFSGGLREAAALHGVSLVGGDTTRGGQIVVAVHLIAEIETDAALLRSGARPGDGVFVSGWLGDAAAGLRLLSTGAELDAAGQELAMRFSRPQARVELGRRLLGVASSAIDVSDGFASDLSKLLDASGQAGEVDLSTLPLSDSLRDAFSRKEALGLALEGGDDYELCFTAPRDSEAFLTEIANDVGVPLTRVGTVTAGTGLRVLDDNGDTVSTATGGYRHFGGANE